jgi:hypothetical protein
MAVAFLWHVSVHRTCSCHNVQFRDAAKNHVPGMDPAALAAAKQANKSKSAKRNERRKEKQATEKAAGSALPANRPSATADAAAARMQHLSLDGGDRGNSSGAAPAPAAGPAVAADDPSATERQIRALKKKVRPCSVLLSAAISLPSCPNMHAAFCRIIVQAWVQGLGCS